MTSIDEAPKYGPDAMRDHFEEWASAGEELKVTLEEIIDAGDQVVVVARQVGLDRCALFA